MPFQPSNHPTIQPLLLIVAFVSDTNYRAQLGLIYACSYFTIKLHYKDKPYPLFDIFVDLSDDIHLPSPVPPVAESYRH